MRKITNKVVGAFVAGEARTSGNTSTDGKVLRLHGNVIAERRADGTIAATLAGWPTPTTRERLNGLCQLLGTGSMFGQKQFQQYFGIVPILADEWVVIG